MEITWLLILSNFDTLESHGVDDKVSSNTIVYRPSRRLGMNRCPVRRLEIETAYLDEPSDIPFYNDCRRIPRAMPTFVFLIRDPRCLAGVPIRMGLGMAESHSRQCLFIVGRERVQLLSMDDSHGLIDVLRVDMK